jgi:hypothetical protein
MLTRLKFALAAVLVVGTASAALAANKHAVRHEQPTVRERVVAPGYSAYGYYGPRYYRPLGGEETYIGVQDQYFRESNGN